MKSMISVFGIAASVLSLLSVSIRAQTEVPPSHYNGSLGFHNTSAPLGGRWWFGGQKVGLDVGIGFRSNPAPSYDENLTGWAVDAGVPIALKSWDKVHLLFRPGLMFDSQERQMSSPPEPFATDDETNISVTAEIEAEVFIVDNFSVSASHGIGFFRFDPAGGGDSETSLGTLGNNFSHIGFHVYFFGGKASGGM